MLSLPVAHAVWMASVCSVSTLAALSALQHVGYRVATRDLVAAELFLGLVALSADGWRDDTLAPVVGLMVHVVLLAVEEHARRAAEARWPWPDEDDAEQRAMRESKLNPNEAA